MVDSTRDRLTHAHVYISGKVQGVGFRFSTVNQAQSLGITGWVRNLSDGRVEAVLEGKPLDVEKMIHWCHSGPPGAIVKDVEHEYRSVKGFKNFETRY
ncbi:acylphosphatase [Spirulina sp. CS-785/01]|uniref:acylphosphatase n=1 Tax=Spirulina sp. CS-785/01 TaxID=3021716 RepID=UPI00232F946F|nr:acylphosphatase [Spirulina sp. CS-785/01]MDB9311698.1 acylphosphatase [Spirulina sp. CS-785/01]